MDQPAYKAPTTRTASIGVSTQHGALVDHSIRSRGMNAGSAPPKGRTETVFLDLRTSTKDNEEKKEVNVCLFVFKCNVCLFELYPLFG